MGNTKITSCKAITAFVNQLICCQKIVDRAEYEPCEHFNFILLTKNMVSNFWKYFFRLLFCV